MSEIVFLIEEAPETGLSARALGESIFTQADFPSKPCAMKSATRRAATSKNTIGHPSSACQNQR